MSCCHEAAQILIAVLGGEEMTKKVAGGTRWWQVRGIAGVEANWVANKKEWNKAARQRSASDTPNRSQPSNPPVNGHDNGANESDTYTPELDPMRCMLYFHGGMDSSIATQSLNFQRRSTRFILGGYFFGSTDQERLCINRYSRYVITRTIRRCLIVPF